MWHGGVQPAQESLFWLGNATFEARYYCADDMAGVHSGLCLSVIDSKDVFELLAERIVTAIEALLRRRKMSSLIGHAIERPSRCALS